MNKAEEYLDTIREMIHKIDALEDMKKETQEQIGMIKSKQEGTGNKPSKGSLEKDIINSMVKLERLDRTITKEQTRYLMRKRRAYEQIMRLKEGQCRRFLIDYYIKGMSEIEIAYEYRYESTVSIYNLKRRAIKYFSKVFY